MEGKGREEKGEDRRIERARDKWVGEEVRGKRKGREELPLWQRNWEPVGLAAAQAMWRAGLRERSREAPDSRDPRPCSSHTILAQNLGHRAKKDTPLQA